MDQPPEEDTDRPARKRLTPIDVQQKAFRRAMFRGYHEQDVDDFLDEVTEELALLLDEVRRLRERSGIDAPGAGGDLAEARRTADDIVLRAREEAAEILRKARTDAAAAGSGGSGLQPFLGQERAFLQDLSRLIQQHADTIRDMARARSRTAPTPQPAAGADDGEVETIEVGEAETSEPVDDRA